MKIKFDTKILLPIICIIAGIMLLGYSSHNYITDCKNVKWNSTDAVVVDLDSYETSSGGGKHSVHKRTVYVVSYEYYVDNVKYQEKARYQNPIIVGDTITVKYNPNAPSQSTTVTKPDTKGFVILLIFSAVFIIVGVLFFVIILRNKDYYTSSKSEDKPYYHPPKEKRNFKSYLLLLFPICVFLISLVLMYYQPFSVKTIDSNQFVQIMEENGYNAENSLDRIQKEFGMGSIITESYSVNTYNLRIDFCELNTAYNTEILFDGADLGATKYTVNEEHIMVGQNDNFYFVKAYKNNTFVYGTSTIEKKDQLLDLISKMGYYTEWLNICKKVTLKKWVWPFIN